jgi:hypothetical protein
VRVVASDMCIGAQRLHKAQVFDDKGMFDDWFGDAFGADGDKKAGAGGEVHWCHAVCRTQQCPVWRCRCCRRCPDSFSVHRSSSSFAMLHRVVGE